MHQGFCKLCGNFSALCNSHALPDSAFKYIFRNADGKAVVSVDDLRTPIQYSSDSWDVPMLCMPCERKLNEQFDSYGIGVFRGQVGSSARMQDGVRFTGIDRSRLRHFFLSILWRVSISSHESYANIDLPQRWEDQLHRALKSGTSLPRSQFAVGVYKLKDSTPAGGFTNEHLRSFIVAPFGRKYPNFMSVCFLFFGFFVEIFIPGLPAKFRSRPGVLTGSTPIFLAPYQEVDAVPEIMQLLVKALAKHKRGLSAVA